MKYFLFSASILFLCNCSDKLTDAKAEKVINECLEKLDGSESYNIIEGNEISLSYTEQMKNFIANAKKLKKEGYLTFDSIRV